MLRVWAFCQICIRNFFASMFEGQMFLWPDAYDYFIIILEAKWVLSLLLLRQTIQESNARVHKYNTWTLYYNNIGNIIIWIEDIIFASKDFKIDRILSFRVLLEYVNRFCRLLHWTFTSEFYIFLKICLYIYLSCDHVIYLFWLFEHW